MISAIQCAEVTIVESTVDSAVDQTVNLDLVANAITPDLLQPYVAPQRPISFGTSATHYIRAAYIPCMNRDDAVTARLSSELSAFDGMTHRAVVALAASIADALQTSTVTDIEWTRPDAVNDGDATWRDAVVVCVDALSQVVDPTPLLALLARIQRDAAVVVISVPLRQFTLTLDDIGPPTRPDRVREWAFPEMQALLDSAGLDVVFGGLVPAMAANSAAQTGVFVAIRHPHR